MSSGVNGPACYSLSKATLNALTLNLSYDFPSNVKVNAVCPGWLRTEMGGKNADRSPEEGAETIVWLTEQKEDSPSGCFFRDKKIISW